MAYEFICETDQCLSCGVCMDLCPVQCLDMSRSQGPGAEGGHSGLPEMPWLMEYPVQVAKCTGCMVCVAECPTEVIHVVQRPVEPAKAERQGPTFEEPPAVPGWFPLSAYTRESLRKVKPDPWGSLFRWKPRVSRRPTSQPPQGPPAA